jgi:hypothetical protein
VTIDLALFVSKRFMPVAAALLLLISARLVQSVQPSLPAASATEVRVAVAR